MNIGEARALLESLSAWRANFRLDAIEILLSELGHPDRAYPIVHVGGTNGKGSVCAFLDATLRASGRRTGLYTSPHLVDFSERIQVDGAPIAPAVFAGRMEAILPAFEAARSRVGEVTYFELLTALALHHFREERVEAAVVEVGIGGRLDATNAIARPAATVITNVTLEHTDVLGPDVPSIAREKAGILKPGVPLATAARGYALAVLADAARGVGAPVRHVDELALRPEGGTLDGQRFTARWGGKRRLFSTRLLGDHQVENAGLAMLALEGARSALPVDGEALAAGLARARWPGRLDVCDRDPLTLLDGAHNPDAAARLGAFLDRYELSPAVLVLGILKDKDVDSVLERLVPRGSRLVASTAPGPRGLPAAELAARTRGRIATDVVEDPRLALDQARRLARSDGGTVVATGSLYFVGAILASLRDRPLGDRRLDIAASRPERR
ncbi:MAG TPA: folylpolyglutamate synthase/dihydrofolate synthase family protein [Candidatus Thermoplasmatota archaeon]|nr:folylpolyglutamate synthase/dihydrofolate synthase family protein [Candidatus Thermoplasmatota archaeon]